MLRIELVCDLPAVLVKGLFQECWASLVVVRSEGCKGKGKGRDPFGMTGVIFVVYESS